MFQPWIPDCECEADAIVIIGNMFGVIIIMIFLMVLSIYFYKSIDKFLPNLVLFLFSIVIGMTSFGSYIPCMPFTQIGFMMNQTIFFYLKLEEGEFKIW
jgi:hypothetical protein